MKTGQSRPAAWSRTIPEYSVCLVREPRARFKARCVDESKDCYQMFRGAFENLDREHFAVICLDTKNKPIGFNVVAVGSLTLTVVHPREVFKCCLLQNAVSVILAHNHPSGDPKPSSEDHRLTQRLVESADILGIRILDHLIFGRNKYVSFADKGWLRPGDKP